VLRSLFVSVLALLLLQSSHAFAQKASPTPSKPEAEVREAIRKYDEALRKADAAALERLWAEDYVFINAHGDKLTRADRLANIRTGATAFDSLAHVPQEEEIKVYGDVAVYTTLLSIKGRYSGEGQQGSSRALVVWIRREGRWQQIASQQTPVVAR
jgi:uncharacterized protein (TIGR02246 family)